MPELPDLQVFAANLEKLLKGRKVKKVVIAGKKKMKQPASLFNKTVIGQSIKKVFREGKELRIAFSKGNLLGIHLMLHGNLYFFEGKNTAKHTLFELWTDKGVLVITDWQGKANAFLDPELKEAPDALSKEVNYKFLKEKMQSRAIIKNLITDQKVIRGIGNAYADEILWEAKISPFSISSEVPDAAIKKLATSIKKVLTAAEKKINKNHPGIIMGEVRDFMAIHNSRKEKSPGGAAIQKKELGGRSTYYTKEQVLYE